MSGRVLNTDFVREIQSNPQGSIGYIRFGNYLKNYNLQQAYLCYENALLYEKNEAIRRSVLKVMDVYNEQALAPSDCSVFVWGESNDACPAKDLIERIKTETPDTIHEVQYIGSLDVNDLATTQYRNNDKSDVLVINENAKLTPNTIFWMRMGLYKDSNIGVVSPVISRKADTSIVELEHYIDDTSELSDYALLIRNDVLPYYKNATEKGYRNVIVRNSIVIQPDHSKPDSYLLKLLSERIDASSTASVLEVNCDNLATSNAQKELSPFISYDVLEESNRDFSKWKTDLSDKLYDIVILHLRLNDKYPIETYFELIQNSISDHTFIIFASENVRYYENWLPLLSTGNAVHSINSQAASNSDIEACCAKYGRILDRWLIIYGNPSEEKTAMLHTIAEMIPNGGNDIFHRKYYITTKKKG